VSAHVAEPAAARRGVRVPGGAAEPGPRPRGHLSRCLPARAPTFGRGPMPMPRSPRCPTR